MITVYSISIYDISVVEKLHSYIPLRFFVKLNLIAVSHASWRQLMQQK
jgi:hypothetical protein